MKKLFHKPIAFILAFSFILALGVLGFAGKVEAQNPNDLVRCEYIMPGVGSPREYRIEERQYCKGKIIEIPDEQKAGAQGVYDDKTSSWWIKSILQPFLGWVVNMILGFVSLLTGLSGIILNGVVHHTIVHVADNYEKIKGIDVAWKTIRDLGNMGFIFVLLYAAISTIIGYGGQKNQELIVKIIVVAILINFSLFFTKVVIDISNVLALVFYEAMVPGAASHGVFQISTTGLSQAFTQYLNLTSIFGSSTTGGHLSVDGIITMGLMGSILLLIAAFVFFAIALMLIIRYVVLIIVLILSPIAFLSFVLPEMKKYRDQWWEALTGQAFFAPIYFALTWITLKILAGIMRGEDAVFGKAGSFADLQKIGVAAGSDNVAGASETGIVATFINFAVVIAFMIISLVIAKDWANKAPGGVSKLTSWATGKAGEATFGMAGRFGRGTIGRAGQAIGENEWLKERAVKSNFVGKFAAQQTLKGGRKVGGGSFDLRGTGLNDQLQAGKAHKGGFADDRKKKSEDEAKFAASLAPSDKTKAKVRNELEEANSAFEMARGTENESAARERLYTAQRRVHELEGVKKEEQDKMKTDLIKDDKDVIAEKEADEKTKSTTKAIKEDEEALKKLNVDLSSAELEETKKHIEGLIKAKQDEKKAKEELLKKQNTELEAAKIASQKAKERIEDQFKTMDRMGVFNNTAEKRKAAYADATEKSYWAKFRGYNYTAAAQIRKGKDIRDEAADILKKLAKESGVETEEKKPESSSAPEGDKPKTT